jgi:hypothetical protein
MRGVAQMQFEHSETSVLFRQRDVDSLFKSSPNGCVKNPWDVGGAKHQNAFIVATHS